MSTLRQAVQEYVEVRRRLGFKLRETERGLIDFAAFLEANDTPHITTELALAWAQRPSRAQSFALGETAGVCPRIRPSSSCR